MEDIELSQVTTIGGKRVVVTPKHQDLESGQYTPVTLDRDASFEEIHLRWDKITYTVPLPKSKDATVTDTKTVLSDLHGQASSGEILAIMGTSGNQSIALIECSH